MMQKRDDIPTRVGFGKGLKEAAAKIENLENRIATLEKD